MKGTPLNYDDPMGEFKTRYNRETSRCWRWLPVERANGYGRFYGLGYREYAHRASWLLHKGPIPPHLMVLHRCNNKECVNPRHLYLGTKSDNAKDMIACNGHGWTKESVVKHRASMRRVAERRKANG